MSLLWDLQNVPSKMWVIFGEIFVALMMVAGLFRLVYHEIKKEMEKNQRRRNGGDGTRRFVGNEIAKEAGASFQIVTRGGKLG
jgi:hypothetical protein